jgi:cytoskeletal protein CcmA (bactofilin family)
MKTANSARMEDNETRVTTVIADDLEIKGSISFKSSLMIKGKFEGEIHSEGLLIVGPTATVQAEITTNKLITYGKIVGNVSAEENVVLKTDSSLKGDITTPNIIIETGSGFNGSCIMKRDYRPPPKEPERPATPSSPSPFDYKQTFFTTPETTPSETAATAPEKPARPEIPPPPAPPEDDKKPPRPDDKGQPPKKKGFWGR